MMRDTGVEFIIFQINC